MQNYANHPHRPVMTTVAGLFTLVAIVAFSVVVARDVSWLAIGLLSLSSGVLTLVLISRAYTVRLQTRIIRLEMQLRLARLGRADDLARLTTPQIVGLRFASDAEMPALIDRAVAEKLTGDQIKRAVTDWQGDHLRT
jgi:predicted lysophospholipase L1 biosynthesis ABC-type transport system permease subunit